MCQRLLSELGVGHMSMERLFYLEDVICFEKTG